MITHVRVRIARGTLIGIESRHRIGRTLRKAVEIEPDLKRSKVEVFQHDAFGRDGDLSLAEIDRDTFELILQSSDFCVKLRDRGDGCLRFSQGF